MCDKSKLVKRLLAAKDTPFIPEDGERLEEMDEKQLKKIAAGLEAPDEEEEEEEEGGKVKEKVVAAAAPAASAPKTAEQWLAEAPEELRSMVDGYKAIETERRGVLVKALASAQSVRSAEVLAKMPTADLMDLAKMLKLDQPAPNYLGVALPVEVEERAAAEPPDPFVEAIARRRKELKLA